MSTAPQFASAPPPDPLAVRAAVVAPRFEHDPSWPWLTELPPLDRWRFDVVRVGHRRLGAATRAWRQLQLAAAARRARAAQIAFLFSTDVAAAVAPRLAAGRGPAVVYVGFTQDARWPAVRMATMGTALRACDAVTVFTDAERALYIDRYGLCAERVRVIPIHADAAERSATPPAVPPARPPAHSSRRGSSSPPAPPSHPFALALGITNRRFAATARACRRRGIPLVVLTRPQHAGEPLDELRGLGASIILDADPYATYRFIEAASMVILQFADHGLPAGFTTAMHAMRLGTPVVAGPSIGMDEHVAHGRTGLLTPRDDEPALEAAIARIWDDRSFAAAVADAARRRAVERHDAAVAARAFHGLAQELLSSTAPGRRSATRSAA